MRKLINIFLVYLLFLPVNLFTQQETIIAPDTISEQKEILNDTSVTVKEKTEKSGEDSKVVDLSPPKMDNLISLNKIFWALLFFLITFYVIRIITKILDRLAENSTTYRITIKGFIPIVRIFGWSIILYIIIAGIFAPPIETIIAITASVGIAVGFASQDILKNIFGGIMILFDRPFLVGDKIEIGKHYGEVVRIGLRSTRIVTPDDSLVSIPNGEIMNQSVSNVNNGEPNCQVVAEIYLPIHINTEKAREIAIRSAQVSKFVYLNKPIVIIFLNDFIGRKSVLKMRIKAYVLDIRYEFPFKSEMTEIVIKELLKENLFSANEFI